MMENTTGTFMDSVYYINFVKQPICCKGCDMVFGGEDFEDYN